MRGRRSIFIASAWLALIATAALGQLREQSPNNPPALEQTPAPSTGNKSLAPADAPTAISPKEKLARVFSNEPMLVRLARDRFGAELTETDANFFTAVINNDWADFRPSPETKFNPQEPSSWAVSPTLKADRINWLCTDPAAVKLVPSHGLWLRGASIAGRVDLYRTNVPFALTFYDCLFCDGLNISHAKLQELDLRNCCSANIEARSVQLAENFYLLTTCVFGGLDFIDANIGGDFDFSGGLAFHGMKTEDLKKQGVALNFHDAKVVGDIRLGDKFRAIGQVRLIGATIGRSLTCGGGKFKGGGQTAIDARRAQIGCNVVFTTGFLADGGVELRRAKLGGDLDCNGGRFIASNSGALSADLIDVGGQVLFGEGFHAEGEVRLINATIAGDVDCDNGHFLNPGNDALTLDGCVIGRSLRIGLDPSAAADESKELPTGFLSRGTFRLWSTQVAQDVLANGAQFDFPTGTAVLACNLKVASRVVLTAVKANGTVNLFSADIEHELDLRGSEFDGQKAFSKIAFWGNGMHIRGHVFCNQVDGGDAPSRFVCKGLTSFQFATISMHWDLYGAELTNTGGDALDASDCRVGGYINLDTVKIDGRATFSRAKIDGMWIINKTVQPENMRLDMRFAHIWVIKDESLDDWPPAGQLQLEGLVYDHFDDDSPLDVNDRLAWLRRQYVPPRASTRTIRVVSSEMPKSPGSVATIAHHETSTDVATTVTQRGSATQSDDRYAVAPAGFRAATMPAPTHASVTTTAESDGKPNPITPVADSTNESTGSAVATPAPQSAAPRVARVEKTADAAQADAALAATSEDTGTNTTDSIATTSVPPDPTGRRYITQPYTQLASVYRAIGLDEQASTVLVARAQRLGELAPAFSAHGLWYRYVGRLIGYGYEPFRAVKIGLVIIAIGALVFTIGARRNLMAETKLAEQVLSDEAHPGQVSPSYPRFNSIVYSLDVFLPFVDLNQVCYWIPGEKPHSARKSRNCLMHIGPYSLKLSALLHCYLWFQTLAGWTLCTLLAAAVAGIVQS